MSIIVKNKKLTHYVCFLAAKNSGRGISKNKNEMSK